MTHGYSKDHRPDLKQAVLELTVSQQDGGVPCVSKSWAGNTSDTELFQKRAEALMRAFNDTPSPRDLVADAKLHGADHAAHLAKLGFITRTSNHPQVRVEGHCPGAPVGYLAVA